MFLVNDDIPRTKIANATEFNETKRDATQRFQSNPPFRPNRSELMVPKADCARDSFVTATGIAGVTCPRSGLVALAPVLLCLAATEDSSCFFFFSVAFRFDDDDDDEEEEESLAVEDGESFSWLPLEDMELRRKVN